jgi:hypothetical protein
MAIAYNPIIITDGLVFCVDAANPKSYPGTGTQWFDLTTNKRNGTLINGTGYSATDGGTLVFDGTDDFVEVPYSSYWNDNVFGTATNFTIECWYKPDVFENWDTVIEKSEASGWYSRPEGASIWINSTGIQGVYASGVDSNPAGSYVIISYTTATLKWYHICLTGDGTTLRLYVDGIERGTGLVSSRTVPVYNGSVGPRFGRRQYMAGQLASTRFYTRGLSNLEIQQNFNATRGRYGV